MWNPLQRFEHTVNKLSFLNSFFRDYLEVLGDPELATGRISRS